MFTLSCNNNFSKQLCFKFVHLCKKRNSRSRYLINFFYEENQMVCVCSALADLLNVYLYIYIFFFLRHFDI